MNLDFAATSSTRGVRLAGSGSFVPEGKMTNADFEAMLETSDEWIVKRTGIKERRVVDPRTEGTLTMSTAAIKGALEDAGMDAKELDLIICSTVTPEMACPSTSCQISGTLGAAPAACFDVGAACSGFVYGINLADSLIRSGRFSNVAVVGCDTMTSITDYTDRGTAILFGDAAGAVVLTADEDPSKGCIYQNMGADGTDYSSLYIPRKPESLIPGDPSDNALGSLRMQGREVYKFAVTRFQKEISDALKNTGLQADEVSAYLCHQSNQRIIESAIDKLSLPAEKVYINIDKHGNSSAGSVGLCLDQMRKADRIPDGEPFVMVAFGGGLTWASSVWMT